MCAITSGQPRDAGEQPRQRCRAGEVVADRAGAGVHHDRRAGVLEHAPDRVEQRVVEVELPHLQVHLEDLDAGGDERRDVRRRLGLGVERRRPQRLRHVGAEAGRPVVEVRRDARLVRVGQRREPAYAHRPQQLDPLVVRLAVADRPLPADLRPGGVELLHTARWMFGGRKWTCTSKSPGRPSDSQKRRTAATSSWGFRDGCCAPPRPPAQSHALGRRPIACSVSRLACRSASACRLSHDFLPLASAISTLARPSRK